jgi:uncharacterized repeat protein (TIGR03803 family)
MRILNSARDALVVYAVVAALAGCNSGLQSSVPGPTGFNPAQTVPTGSAIGRETGDGQLRHNSLGRASVTDRLIHCFGAAGDGLLPYAALLDVNGTLYGTTSRGGANGYGTVFAITSGKETVVHSFDSTDGAYPQAKLIDVNGTLYGTTPTGGANGSGTVFSIRQSSELSTVYNFMGGSDGSGPAGVLTNVNGTLYGTTETGGTYNDGTVFSVNTTGYKTVLHSFGGPGDGINPLAGLLNINGTLYGTTYEGGTTGCEEPCGTVFSVTTSGSEKVLHRFSRPPDGRAPLAGLTNVNGTIYGTTDGGGTGTCECGTVFSIDASGNEKVLHSFAGPPDGEYPQANLLNVNGTLYGTTIEGGLGCGGLGCGVVFSVTTSGQEAVLYSFKGIGTGHPDGSDPVSALIDVKGTLFGTTARGGAYGANKECGGFPRRCGTVFAVTP